MPLDLELDLAIPLVLEHGMPTLGPPTVHARGRWISRMQQGPLALITRSKDGAGGIRPIEDTATTRAWGSKTKTCNRIFKTQNGKAS